MPAATAVWCDLYSASAREARLALLFCSQQQSPGLRHHSHHAAAWHTVCCAMPCSCHLWSWPCAMTRNHKNCWLQHPTGSINRASGVLSCSFQWLTDPAVRKRKRKDRHSTSSLSPSLQAVARLYTTFRLAVSSVCQLDTCLALSHVGTATPTAHQLQRPTPTWFPGLFM